MHTFRRLISTLTCSTRVKLHLSRSIFSAYHFYHLSRHLPALLSSHWLVLLEHSSRGWPPFWRLGHKQEGKSSLPQAPVASLNEIPKTHGKMAKHFRMLKICKNKKKFRQSQKNFKFTWIWNVNSFIMVLSNFFVLWSSIMLYAHVAGPKLNHSNLFHFKPNKFFPYYRFSAANRLNL